MTVGPRYMWGRSIRQELLVICMAKNGCATVCSLPVLHVAELACAVGGRQVALVLYTLLFYLSFAATGTCMHGPRGL
jgi:hypothetical protein